MDTYSSHGKFTFTLGCPDIGTPTEQITSNQVFGPFQLNQLTLPYDVATFSEPTPTNSFCTVASFELVEEAGSDPISTFLTIDNQGDIKIDSSLTSSKSF